MSITPGTRIGPYEVSALLGKGGMGEVYLATDTNLKRQVAVKVLPLSVSSDAERLARFQREAEVLAALNHPHIAAIYGLERTTDLTALVMELVEGPTLEEILSLKPKAQGLPVDEALRLASQIAEAVGAAHEQGIVHRDLKPANIKVRSDGTIKVLDFGLAKAADTASAAGMSAISPTMTIGATAMGVILGTAAYMSPEQASGKPVDKRADIWAFGVVLWEMLTGRQLFEGETVSHVLAAVLTKEPDLTVIPPRVRPLLARCFERDPRKRLRDIGDAMALVQEADTRAPEVKPSRGWFAFAGWAAAVVFAVALAVVAFRALAPPVDPGGPLVRFQVLRSSVDTYNTGRQAFALSPDGRFLAFYEASSSGQATLRVRTLASGEAREIPGSGILSPQGPPLWSADGNQILFQRLGTAQIYDLSLGTARPFCTCRFRGGSWNRDGVILLGASPAGAGPIRRLSLTDRTLRDVTTANASKREQDTLPAFLPDGRRFLFTRTTPGQGVATYLGTLDRGEERRIVDGSRHIVVVSSTGSRAQLLGIDDAGLVAQAIDLGTMTVAPESSLVVAGAFAASGSDNGILATSAPGNRARLIPTWFDRTGKTVATIGEAGIIESVSLTVDGSRLVVAESRGDALNDIWVRNLSSGAYSRLTFRPDNDADPIWSPDGKRIIASTSRDGLASMFERAADGTGTETIVVAADRNTYANDWSRDGRWLIYTIPKTGGGADLDLWVVPMDQRADRKPTPYLEGSGREAQATFSPDSRFVAYISDESGTSEVYVQPFPNASEGKWMISSGGGAEPRWSPDGKELFYFTGQTLMAVPVNLQPTFSNRPPVRLFDAPIQAGFINDSDRWQVAPDGQRFILLAPAGKNDAPPIDIVVNWTQLLKK